MTDAHRDAAASTAETPADAPRGAHARAAMPAPARRRLLAALPALALAPVAGRAFASAITDAFAAARPSIVAVGTTNPLRNPHFAFQGTGFVVGDGNLVATCSHVVGTWDPANHDTLAVAVPRAGTGFADVFEADIFARDADADVAVLKLRSGGPLPALAIGADADPPVGADVVAIGFPLGNTLGLYPTVHRGLVSALVPSFLPKRNAVGLSAQAIKDARARHLELYQLDLIAFPGNSGSPLIDVASGRVIGIVSMSVIRGDREKLTAPATGISYAVPVRQLRALLPPR